MVRRAAGASSEAGKGADYTAGSGPGMGGFQAGHGGLRTGAVRYGLPNDGSVGTLLRSSPGPAQRAGRSHGRAAVPRKPSVLTPVRLAFAHIHVRFHSEDRIGPRFAAWRARLRQRLKAINA